MGLLFAFTYRSQQKLLGVTEVCQPYLCSWELIWKCQWSEMDRGMLNLC